MANIPKKDLEKIESQMDTMEKELEQGLNDKIQKLDNKCSKLEEDDKESFQFCVQKLRLSAAVEGKVFAQRCSASQQLLGECYKIYGNEDVGTLCVDQFINDLKFNYSQYINNIRI